MARLSYLLALGLLGAAIVHIVVLLLPPYYSEHDAWARLAARGELLRTVQLADDTGGRPSVAVADPFIKAAACRFDLTDGPIHVTASGTVPFWSVSIYDRRGYNFYSFNDRTASGRILDLAIVSPAQMLEMRKSLPDAYADSIFVEFDGTEGIVAARAFMPDGTYAPQVAAFLEALRCQPG